IEGHVHGRRAVRRRETREIQRPAHRRRDRAGVVELQRIGRRQQGAVDRHVDVPQSRRGGGREEECRRVRIAERGVHRGRGRLSVSGRIRRIEGAAGRRRRTRGQIENGGSTGGGRRGALRRLQI